jgi:hypothetical protein
LINFIHFIYQKVSFGFGVNDHLEAVILTSLKQRFKLRFGEIQERKIRLDDSFAVPRHIQESI